MTHKDAQEAYKQIKTLSDRQLMELIAEILFRIHYNVPD